MKHMKKLIVAALAVVTTVALCVPAVAFGATINITRDSTYNGTGGRTYTAYKVLDADTHLTGSNTQGDKTPTYTTNGPIAYTMATNNPWKNAMTASGQTWFDVNLAADQSKYVVALKSSTQDSDGPAIAAYLKQNMPASSALTGDYAGISITPGTAVTVDDGYYLIIASDGATNLTLVTANVNIVEKNTYLGSGKTSPQTNHYVGEAIDYDAYVSIPLDANPAEPIILHDKMTPATSLDYNNDLVAKVGTTDITSQLTVTTTGLTDGCKFEVTIPATVVADNLGETITFEYTATVTAAAASAPSGLVNELFAEENGYETNPVQTTDYTFDFNFLKTFAGTADTDTTKTATFQLRTNATDANSALKFSKEGNKYTYNTAGSANVTVNNHTQVTFHGLAEGTYYLVETATSNGYNLLTAPLTVAIVDTTTDPATAITYTVNGGDPTIAVTVENQQGTVLPSTGGIGTTIFYIIGAVLVIGAGVVLITKRRVAKRNKNDEL